MDRVFIEMFVLVLSASIALVWAWLCGDLDS